VRAALAAGGWRLAVVAGLAAGLGASPFWSPPGGLPQAAAGLACLLVLLTDRGRVTAAGAALVLCAAALVGLAAGGARLAAIDDGAFAAKPGTTVTLAGIAETAPRASRGVSRFVIASDRGRLMVEALSVPQGIEPGTGISASGAVGPAPDWYRPNLERQGLAMMLTADSVELTGARRGGVEGWLDRIRSRAEDALGLAMPEREAALARGFVLGQDQQIDEQTVTDFQNSGLAHLLAVSGQNVVLLCLLALPLLALGGFGHRSRLAAMAVLILVYVPLAGGGASIQRAGVMGLAGLAALAASRPASRLYVLGLAAAVTLLINPRAGADVGWQLSFAAVIGIGLLAGPLARRVTGFAGSPAGAAAGAAIDGAAVTVAATITTAPLMAFHFERLPTATVPANLLALPAVAPAMWLGMISAALGQVWALLAVPFNLVNSLLLAYLAQVASWFGRPSWAVIEFGIGSAASLGVAYAALGAIVGLGLWLTHGAERDPVELPPVDRRASLQRRSLQAAAGLAVLIALLVLVLPGSGRRELGEPPAGGVRIEILDVGQGDATLIRPDGTDPILVDGGPPGDGIDAALRSAGVDRLVAVAATHADLDHVGGLYDVFEGFEVGAFLFDGAPADLISQARSADAQLRPTFEGQRMVIGPVMLEVLWPPARTADFTPPEDRNTRSVTLLVSCLGYRVLLTGDGEAEAVPVDPGPIDVLRVAHHGSDDAGLPGLLAEAQPSLAVISVGADNSYGHPTPETMRALEAAVPEILRTDQVGTVSLVIGHGGLSIETGD
jgi:competence protein ComEC